RIIQLSFSERFFSSATCFDVQISYIHIQPLPRESLRSFYHTTGLSVQFPATERLGEAD
ncbi:hypothetical protein PM082_022440, partial [Marasmius tenuissimus]